MQQAGTLLIVDIRTPDEWRDSGVPAGAARVTLGDRAQFIAGIRHLVQDDLSKPLGIICRSGTRSAAASDLLASQGFQAIYDIRAGVIGGRNGPGWIPSGQPVEQVSP